MTRYIIKPPPENYWAIVPAAGSGARMQADLPKQYLKVHEKTILEHTLDTLANHTIIRGIVVALAAEDAIWPSLDFAYQNKLIITEGGSTRAESVYKGLMALKPLAGDNDWVLVHDAARPCLRHTDIDKLIHALKDHPVGGILGTRVCDTLKRVDETGNMLATVARDDVWQALTPQMYRYGKLLHAVQYVIENGISVTDEAAAFESLGISSLVVEGRRDNIKVTFPDDLQWVKLYLQNK
jgi:2-C-methyl-D-erythritol 4-phosphate cytidylyltransferase